MKPGDIVTWLSVDPRNRHSQLKKRFAELVSFEPQGRYVKLKVIGEDNKEILIAGVSLNYIQVLTSEEKVRVQHLGQNALTFVECKPKETTYKNSQLQTMDPETYPLLDEIDRLGKRVKRIDLFGGEITALLEDDKSVTKNMGNPLANVYALRKWFKLRHQSWGPLG